MKFTLFLNCKVVFKTNVIKNILCISLLYLFEYSNLKKKKEMEFLNPLYLFVYFKIIVIQSNGWYLFICYNMSF